jgi:hypothetical protein
VTGWVLSGFRRVAHFIVLMEDGDHMKARCGTMWWMSDAVSGHEAQGGTPRCKRCAHTKEKDRG